MSYIVQIRREADKVVRSYRYEFDWELGSDYLWRDGNNSCDCNRALYFARAAGEEEPWDDLECGDEAYAVRITDLAGNELYADDRWRLVTLTAAPWRFRFPWVVTCDLRGETGQGL